MNKTGFFCLLIGLTFFVISTYGYLDRRPGRKYCNPALMKDEHDLRDYYANETAARKTLTGSQLMSRSFLPYEFQRPSCSFANWTNPSCCLSFMMSSENRTLCLNILLHLQRLKIVVSLDYALADDPDSNTELFAVEFLLSKFCVRLPALPKIAVCGHIYYFDSNFGHPFFMITCLTVIIADVFELRFYCIALDNWELERVDEIEPEEKAIFAVAFKKDRIVFEFNLAIPEELYEILKGVASFVSDTILVLYNTMKAVVVQVWNSIATFFKSIF